MLHISTSWYLCYFKRNFQEDNVNVNNRLWFHLVHQAIEQNTPHSRRSIDCFVRYIIGSSTQTFKGGSTIIHLTIHSFRNVMSYKVLLSKINIRDTMAIISHFSFTPRNTSLYISKYNTAIMTWHSGMHCTNCWLWIGSFDCHVTSWHM